MPGDGRRVSAVPSSVVARLLIVAPESCGQQASAGFRLETPLVLGASLRIGRAPDADLVLSGPGVSRIHCRVAVAEGATGGAVATLVDEGSHNGTFVNGVPIRERVLRHGDQIRVSSWSLLFLASEPDASETAAATRSSSVTRTQQLDHGLALYLEPQRLARTGTSVELIEGLLRLPEVLPSLDFDAASEGRSDPSPCAALTTLLRETFVADECSLHLLGAGLELLGEPAPAWAAEACGSGEPSLLDAVEGSGPGAPASCLAAPLFDEMPLSSSPAPPLGWVFVRRAGGASPAFTLEDLRALTAFAGQLGPALARLGRGYWQSRAARWRGDALLLGESDAMKAVQETVARVAPTPATVLLRGASGTGKEAVARALHQLSDRRDGPFVALNCAAISPQLLESELFGHERGAFTGAVARRIGRLEQAHGGTLLLDEIGEMSPDLQAKLLRVLQDLRFERVGGTRTIAVDVRVLSATNRDLEAAISEGAFRQDLYYRLQVVEIALPDLADRDGDVELLAHYFLSEISHRCGRTVEGFSGPALAALRAHSWPGNVRELRNVVERAVVLGLSELVELEDLPDALAEGEPTVPVGFHASVRDAKREIIEAALRQAGGNVAAAARKLDLTPSYLHRLITQLGLREQSA